MKLSKFIFTTDFPETGEILLYNTLNGAMLSIDKENENELKLILDKKTHIDVTTSLTSALAEEDFLVDEAFDEIEIVLERSRLGIKDGNRLDVIIMPNMNCNFSCPYCYEEHHSSQMTKDTQERLLKWFALTAPRFKAVLISWFGGEPLLSYNTIVDLQEKLVAICNAHDIEFSSHITSNGYLLNPVRIKKLVEVGIRSYQITIDGAPENHNQTRVLKDGTGTFSRIYDNIVSLSNNKNVNVKLRVNYDDKNIESIKKLLPMFPEQNRNNIELICERIFGKDYGMFEDSSMNHGEIIANLYSHASELGYKRNEDELVPGKLTYCYADRVNQFLINYNGDIFKCTVGKFKSEQRLGYLNHEGRLEWETGRLSKWHAVDVFEEKCYSCTFMPLCMGGCRKVRQMFGTVGDDCKLPFEGFEVNVRNIYSKSKTISIT